MTAKRGSNIKKRRKSKSTLTIDEIIRRVIIRSSATLLVVWFLSSFGLFALCATALTTFVTTWLLVADGAANSLRNHPAYAQVVIGAAQYVLVVILWYCLSIDVSHLLATVMYITTILPLMIFGAVAQIILGIKATRSVGSYLYILLGLFISGSAHFFLIMLEHIT